jgi:GNAT superfamily N-acetyltransferase
MTPDTPAAAPTAPDGTPPPVRIDDARLTDQSPFLSLLSTATPDEPMPLAVHMALFLEPGPPLSHGDALCLIARDAHHRPVGALIGGVPRWVYENPHCAEYPVRDQLASRVAIIHGMAVHPDHRRQGIARKLIRAAERRFAHAGYRLLTLQHTPDRAPVYAKLGFRSSDMLLINLPGGNLLTQQFGTMRSAARPLATDVDLVTVPGAPAPVVSGILPGSQISPTMRYTGGRLTP